MTDFCKLTSLPEDVVSIIEKFASDSLVSLNSTSKSLRQLTAPWIQLQLDPWASLKFCQDERFRRDIVARVQSPSKQLSLIFYPFTATEIPLPVFRVRLSRWNSARVPFDLKPKHKKFPLLSWKQASKLHLELDDFDAETLASFPNICGLALPNGAPVNAVVSVLKFFQDLTHVNIRAVKIFDLQFISSLHRLRVIDIAYTLCTKFTGVFPDLQQFICSGTKLVDLAFLAQSPRLEVLNCANTSVSNLNFLSSSLRVLDCGGTEVGNFRFLRRTPWLEELSLTKLPIKDLSMLRYVKNLRKLSIESTPIKRLDRIAILGRLESLNCSGTPISHFSGLPVSLKKLDACGTEITDLSGLSHLPQLEDLDVSETDIEDLWELSDLHSLKFFSCQETEVTDLGPLAGLRSLKRVGYDWSRVDDPSVLMECPNIELDCIYDAEDFDDHEY